MVSGGGRDQASLLPETVDTMDRGGRESSERLAIGGKPCSLDDAMSVVE